MMCMEVNVAWSLPLDRMRVMAALETLTRHWDPVAARDVVVAFQGVPRFNHRGVEWQWRVTGRRSHVDGLTDFGLVRQTDRAADTSGTAGVPSEQATIRIGRFKVYAIGAGSYPSVIFYDFRSDTRVPGALPEERWQLLYDADALRPLILSRLVPAPGRVTWYGQFICWLLKFRYGKNFSIDSHDFSPVVMHSELPEDNA